jgi:hypothetical protein
VLFTQSREAGGRKKVGQTSIGRFTNPNPTLSLCIMQAAFPFPS